MKIVIPCQDRCVSPHFGLGAGSYVIFEIHDQKVEKVTRMVIEDKPCFLPQFFNGLGINIVICQHMGRLAYNLFIDLGIEVYLGVHGSCVDAVNEFINQTLISDDSYICSKHSYNRCCNHKKN